MNFCSKLTLTLLLAGTAHLHAGEVTHFYDASLAEEEGISFATSASRGDLVYSGYLPEKAGATSAMEQLDAWLKTYGASRADILRLNLHILPTPEARQAALAFVRNNWPEEKTPAITLVPGSLPEGVTFACDAVSLSGKKVEDASLQKTIVPGSKSIIYASGRVARGKSLEEAISNAMKLIQDDYLQSVGADFDQVVQVRAYLPDLSQWEEAKTHIGKWFDTAQQPPIIPMDWKRPNTVEIEVIAPSEPRKADSPAEYITPEAMTVSPAYTPVVLVHAKEITFFTAISEPTSENAEAGVRAVFTKQWKALEAAGTDKHHLIKVTYMASSPEADKAVSDVRLDFLDTTRPPSASKVLRNHSGAPGEDFQLDLIAFPKP